MYKFKTCVNRFHPFRGRIDQRPCRCEGTGYVLTGKSSITPQSRPVQFSEAFRARHRLDSA